MTVVSPFEIPVEMSGSLFVMPKPLATELDSEMAALAKSGVTQVVSLLQGDEAAALGLSSEEQACRKAGLSFVHFPIVDFGLPDGLAFAALARDIFADVSRGASVLIHCKGGIGRSGMLTSLVVAQSIGSAERAMEHVSQARGLEVPDTQEQRDFVLRLFSEMDRDHAP
ncbi:MAG: sulfur transferase domain-containing protein [Pseudomonadota bacterium]